MTSVVNIRMTDPFLGSWRRTTPSQQTLIRDECGISLAPMRSRGDTYATEILGRRSQRRPTGSFGFGAAGNGLLVRDNGHNHRMKRPLPSRVNPRGRLVSTSSAQRAVRRAG